MECMPSNFCPKYLVELRMPNSKLVKLWEGVKVTVDMDLSECLKDMDLSESKSLKKIPDLSKATNLETLNLRGCSSLAELPSSIRNLNSMTDLNMAGCTKLKVLPSDVNLPSLIRLNLSGCLMLRDYHSISDKVSFLTLNKTAIKSFSPKLCLDNVVELHMEQIKSKSLWKGVQLLTSLKKIVLSGSKNLKEIPDLSKATSLETLNLNGCSSLVDLTLSSIQNLNKLTTLEMIGCSSLKTLPTGINLESLYCLNLNGCSQLTSFPGISSNISILKLNQTAIKEVPGWIKNFSSLESLEMCGCKQLKTLPIGINLKSLYRLDFSGCSGLSSFPDISRNISTLFLNQTAIGEVPSWIKNFSSLESFEMWECKELKSISPGIFNLNNLDEAYFSDCEKLAEVRWPEKAENTNNTGTNLSMISFINCFSSNQEAFIQQSTSKYLILPGEMPPYFTHQSTGSSLTIPLHHSSLSQQSFLNFKSSVVVSGSKTTNNKLFFIDIEVQCQFRNKLGKYFEPAKRRCFSLHLKYNHQIIFDCHFPLDQECDQVVITFHLPSGGLKFKRCGVRLLDDCAPFPAIHSEADQSIADENSFGEEECKDNSDDEGYETALDEEERGENSDDGE